MKKIYKFRQHVTFTTSKGYIINCEGPWHYVYIEEEIAAARSAESVETYDSFIDIWNECKLWPDCSSDITAFKKRPYIHIWDTWGGRRYYEKEIKEATWFSEYAEGARGLTFEFLMKELPADHFIEYCKDNAFPLKVEVE